MAGRLVWSAGETRVDRQRMSYSTGFKSLPGGRGQRANSHWAGLWVKGEEGGVVQCNRILLVSDQIITWHLNPVWKNMVGVGHKGPVGVDLLEC